MTQKLLLSQKCAQNRLFAIYKRRANRKNQTFKLGRNLFKKLISSNCFYCDVKPSQVLKRANAFILYNGIDRLRNEYGYTTENAVSCCFACNNLKSNLSLDRFLNQISLIAVHFLGLKK